MGSSKFTWMLLQRMETRRLQCAIAHRAVHTEVKSSLRVLLEDRLKTDLPKQDHAASSIYRVPTDLRRVETRAYEPNIVSIGPYHHGVTRLQAMEKLKWDIFHRMFHPSQQNGATPEALEEELKELEQEIRSCYSENLKFSSENFIRIVLIDSCFIVELLRELMKSDFKLGSCFIKRWMLPVLRRDLIMLENQLPLFVLKRVFDLTSSTSTVPSPSLKELALRFFDPLMCKDSDTVRRSNLASMASGKNHFLDLFRSSILPRITSRGKEPHMFRSMAELKESGVKLQMSNSCRPLKLSFNRGVLKIPPIFFDDYKFTLFRNMVAFEQCHTACKPDITRYIFFLDRLINSQKDVELLHYAGVIQHSFGNNKQVARLVNKLCEEVAGDDEDSYLQCMVWKINCHCNDGLTTKIARLKHDYFYNIWVTISSLAGILIIYLTIIQTCCGLKEPEDKSPDFWSLVESFSIPIRGLFRSKKNEDSPICKDKCFNCKALSRETSIFTEDGFVNLGGLLEDRVSLCILLL